ncbi:hypothetical protein [Burkholderia cenocepacia]|uniref:hypothetical protein n=1 Tax=Burkholderia cenocepacia TaxID=95486 RepID=UPI0013E06CFF|nr:hypothetical protein [Burkholderia cenocepacia]
MVRNIDPLNRRLFVRMTAGLLANQPQLFHQAADLEAANRRKRRHHAGHFPTGNSKVARLNHHPISYVLLTEDEANYYRQLSEIADALHQIKSTISMIPEAAH